MSYLTIHLDDIDNFVDHQDSSELTPKEIHEARSKLMAELDKDGDQFLIDLGLEDEVKKFRFIENSSCGSVHDHENGLFESFASTEDDEPCEALQLEVWVLSLSLPLQSIFNKITGKKYAHEIFSDVGLKSCGRTGQKVIKKLCELIEEMIEEEDATDAEIEKVIRKYLDRVVKEKPYLREQLSFFLEGESA